MWPFNFSRSKRQIVGDYVVHGIYLWLTPWFNLLDVYRSVGSQAEFEAVALYLHDDFNCQLTRWQSKEEDYGSKDRLSLEDFPHIMQRITATWGRQACLAYLKTLLEDKRGKTRRGFSLAVFQEILLLAGLLEIELKEICVAGEDKPPRADAPEAHAEEGSGVTSASSPTGQAQP